MLTSRNAGKGGPCSTLELAAAIDRTRRSSMGDLLWRSAARLPDKTALVYRDSRWSYAELDARVNRCAHALASRGVRKGDRIALLSHNNDLFVVLYFALARLGAISVPINFMLNAGEVAYVLEHSGASGIVVEDALLGVVEDAMGDASSLNVRGAIDQGHGEQRSGWEIANAWMEGPDASPPDVPIDDDDCMQLLYTSGTEARPKGAMMATRNLVAQYTSCIVDGEMTGDDIEIHALPLYHCAQLHCFLTPSIRNGRFHSGDLGVVDEDGYLTIVDRKKDMIKTGGENVASREIEEVLYQHPAVAEVAVFGAPHPVWMKP